MTAVEQMIDEFNEELKVAIEIGNEDKIRIIKHLITIATSYLPKREQIGYTEDEVLQLLLKLQQTESYDNLYDWFQQNKKH